MTIVSIVVQSLLAAYYVFSGSAKVAGAKYWTDMSARLGLPQWFRVVTGFVQLLGAAALVVGYWYAGANAWAGSWLGITMLAAFFAHVKAKDPIGKSSPALVFAVLNAVVIGLNASDMTNLF